MQNYWLARFRDRQTITTDRINAGNNRSLLDHSTHHKISTSASVLLAQIVEIGMSWNAKFKQAATNGYAAAAAIESQSQQVTENLIGDFFRQLVVKSEMSPKKVKYVDLDSHRSIPLFVNETERATVQAIREGRGTMFFSAVELSVDDEHISTGLPVWIRMAFHNSDRGLMATFGEQTVLIPTETDRLLQHIEEMVVRRLQEGSGILPVKLGF